MAKVGTWLVFQKVVITTQIVHPLERMGENDKEGHHVKPSGSSPKVLGCGILRQEGAPTWPIKLGIHVVYFSTRHVPQDHGF